MTAIEAIEIAERAITNMNLPGSRGQAMATRCRYWPFQAVWRVVAHVTDENAIVTIKVFERSREAWAAGAQYPAK